MEAVCGGRMVRILVRSHSEAWLRSAKMESLEVSQAP